MEYDDLHIIEEQNDIEVIQTVDVIEVEDFETYTVDSDVAFPALGESNEYLKHQLFNGRELPDQHPITAITGLREELDNIEALQTVYSNEKQIADYYKWEDGNTLKENRTGYFVSLCENLKDIKICNGTNVYGVTVDNAAFVGGQSDVTRDHTYGLVIYTGIALVRCELDVDEGDYITSNNYGMAQKSDVNCGYQVVAISEVNGIRCAVVSLNLSVDQINLIGRKLKTIDYDLEGLGNNVLSAINIANKALKEVNNIGQIADNVIQNSNEVVGKVEEIVEKVENVDQQILEAMRTSAEAEAIANAAIVNAETIRIEAMEKIDEVRDDMDATKEEMKVDLDEAVLEFDQTVSDMIHTRDKLQNQINSMESNINMTSYRLTEEIEDVRNEIEEKIGSIDMSDITDDIQKTKEQIEANKNDLITTKEQLESDINELESSVTNLTTDLNPILTWENGVAGFISEVEENSATIGTLITNQTETAEALSSFQQEVGDTYATITQVNTVETEMGKSIAAVKSTADANKASLDLLASYENGDNKGITGLKTQVNKNSSDLLLLTSYENENSEAIASLQTKADETSASLESLNSYKNENSEVVAGLKTQVNANTSNLNILTSRQDDSVDVIARLQSQVSDNEADINLLAGFEYGNNQYIYPYKDSPAPNDENKTIGDILVNGITFTDNGDTTITVNGNATSDAIFYIIHDVDNFSEGEYLVSGCPNNGSNSTYCIYVYIKKKETDDINYFDIGDINNKCKFELVDGDKLSIMIKVFSGYYADNLNFTPSLKKVFSGLSGLTSQVSKNGSSIDLLTSFNSDAGTGTAGLIGKVTDHDAQLNGITSWKNQTSETLTSIKQVSDEHESKIDIMTAWKSDVEDDVNNIANIQLQSDENKSAIESVASLQTETSNALSSFKQEVVEDYATKESLTSFLTEDSEAITLIKETAEKNRAELDAVASYATDDGTGLAGLAAKVDANSSELSAIASYDKDGKSGLAGLKAQVDENASELSNLAEFEYEDNKGLAGLKARVDDNTSVVDVISSFTGKDANGNPVTGASGLTTQVTVNESKISTLATSVVETTQGIAGLNGRVTQNEANLKILADFTCTSENLVSQKFYDTQSKGTSFTTNGLTFTDNKNGTITVNGTSTAITYYTFVGSSHPLTLQKGDYILSGNSVKDKGISIYLHIGELYISDFGESKSFSLDTTKTSTLGLQIPSNITLNNVTFRPCVKQRLSNGLSGLRSYAESSSAGYDLLSSYERRDADGYLVRGVSGIMSEVESNSANLDIISNFRRTGDNLLTYPYVNIQPNVLKTICGVNFTDHGDGTITVNGTATGGSAVLYLQEITLEQGTYILSGNPIVNQHDIHLYVGNGTLYYPDRGNTVEFTVTSRTTFTVGISVIKEKTADNGLFKPCLVKVISDGVAAFKQAVDDQKSATTILNTWRSRTDSTIQNIATIETKVTEQGASIAQVVSNGKVNAASIVTAINNSGSSVTLKGDHIVLNGAVTANGTFTISKDGYIAATGGTIGGWTINESRIECMQDENHRVYLNKPTAWTDVSSADVLVIKNGNTWPFALRADGTLRASKAEITGYIKATSGEFNGKIVASSGQIGKWVIDTNVIYSDIKTGTNSNGVDIYQSCGMSNESTSSGAVVFWAGYDGALSTPVQGYNYYKDNNITNTTWQAHTPFYVTRDGEMHASNAFIKGKIEATSGSFSRDVTIGGRSIKNWMNSSGYITNIKANSGTIGVWNIGNNSLYGYDGNYYVEMTPGWLSAMYSGDAMEDIRWYDLVCESIYGGSDRKIKNNIVQVDDTYEEWFDRLKPVSFNYTKEYTRSSYDKLHFGFVAQDILQSADECGLENLALIYGSDYYRLEKSEIIALNTWQIQKAKARISELEEKVLKLEQLIKEK